MNYSPSIRVAITIALLLVVATGQTTSNPETPLATASATIVDFKGEVTLETSQGANPSAQRGLTLDADTTIDTGKGSVLLSLQDGSQVLLKAHTRAVLKAPEQSNGSYLELLLGNILAKVQKRLGVAPSFRMGTPTAVITVRGTRFTVEVTRKQKTIVDVYEGLVEVAGIAPPSPPVLLRPGFYMQLERDRPPQSPREMNPDIGSQSEREGNSSRPGQGDWESEGSRSGAPGGRSGGAGSEPPEPH